MILLVALHVVAACGAPVALRRLGRRAFWLLAIAPAVATGWALANAPIRGSAAPVERYEWAPSIGLSLTFRTDSLAWLLLLVIGAIGVLVLGYCAAYFEDDEPGLGRFGACLTAFAGAMIGLVTADDMLLLYVFWEITTVLSYLLIGHSSRSRASRAAATQALVVTTFGGLAMLGGIVIVGQRAGTYRLSELTVPAAQDADGVLVTAVVLLLVGAISKSALVPFHYWLPGAMAAPTPVSAYLHAAAMVKAGIYLVARLAPAYAQLPAWRTVCLVLGGTTMLLGAYRALRQHDLKLLLAFGTVSQLGFLVVLVGTGTEQAALAGVTMLLAHALFKGCLFLTVGAIDHATGTRDLRVLSGLRHRSPGLAAAGLLGAASMAGLPPLLGFVGKEAVYTTYLATEADWAPYVLVVLVAGSALTVAYSGRFVWGAFRDRADAEPSPFHAAGPVLVGIPLLLAVAGLIAGPISPLFEPALTEYARLLPDGGGEVHLGVWHGFGAPLLLSAATLLVGAGLVAARRPINRAQTAIGHRTAPYGADEAYRGGMRRLDHGSVRITGTLQRGSLPLSMALILLTTLGTTGYALWVAKPVPATVRPYDDLAQVWVALATGVAAVLAAMARRRMRAVLLVGATGYGCALLFLLFGAPDLALTQVLAESVSLLVFVLVLRRLPSRFDDDDRGRRLLRLALGLGGGALVTALALVVPTWRTRPPASTGLAESALDFGGGRNIVNVILVDTRAWDTMGELSVVIAAATGIASLIFIDDTRLAPTREALARVRARRGGSDAPPQGAGVPREGAGAASEGAESSPADAPSQRPLWLREADAMHPVRRSLLLEVVVRLIFHVALLWSVFLLFTGHNSPGGGFAAGIVAGLALALRYLAGGREELRSALPVPPGLLLGTGLFLSAGNGLASMIVGGQVLQTWILHATLPAIGEIHVVTSLFFDIGVYLVVVGLVLDILRSLGSGIEDQGGLSLDVPVPTGPAEGETR
ncbi:MAG: Na+/H+ antiporter subunit A [Austwickia sp.]|nr:Na+/H+ antiporter subunit A [Actinomycetota bacterium]MCB1253453.1 Na+/H+ antiporter subunit A [Austwickia sp.]